MIGKKPATVVVDGDITIESNENNFQSNPIHRFEEIALSDCFFTLFKQFGYQAPTKIQSIAIPIALEGFDIIGVAKTGSGKTLSFVLPILMAIEDEKQFCKQKGKPYNNQKTPRALVLAPTRELACQIYECAKPFAKAIDQYVVCIYGGAESGPQRAEIANGVDLLIATPGRLYDFVNRSNVVLEEVFIFVLDEADRMLDMGFLPQVRQVSGYLKAQRQTLLWSATWPPEVAELSTNLCKNKPILIRVGDSSLTVNKSITQHVSVVDDYNKKKETLQLLKSKLKSPQDKVLIFVGTKRGCDDLAKNLEMEGYKALSLHGDKHQSLRDKIIEDFKGKASILVATDVASRGLDIKNIKMVINYDFPQCIEDYIHRIGRTGRAGATGDSYTFLTSHDSKHAHDLMSIFKKADQVVPSCLQELSNSGFSGGRSRSRYSSWKDSDNATAFSFKERNGDGGGSFGGRRDRDDNGGGGFGGRKPAFGGGSWGEEAPKASSNNSTGGGWGGSWGS